MVAVLARLRFRFAVFLQSLVDIVELPEAETERYGEHENEFQDNDIHACS